MNRLFKTVSGLVVLTALIYVAWSFRRDGIGSISEKHEILKHIVYMDQPQRTPQRPRNMAASRTDHGNLGLQHIEHRGGNNKKIHRNNQPNDFLWEDARGRQGSVIIEADTSGNKDKTRDRYLSNDREQDQPRNGFFGNDVSSVKDQGSSWRQPSDKVPIGKLGARDDEIEVLPSEIRKDGDGEKQASSNGELEGKGDEKGMRKDADATETVRADKAESSLKADKERYANNKKESLTTARPESGLKPFPAGDELARQQQPLFRPEERVLTTIQPAATNRKEIVKDTRNNTKKGAQDLQVDTMRNSKFSEYRAMNDIGQKKDNFQEKAEPQLQKPVRVETSNDALVPRYRSGDRQRVGVKAHNAIFEDLRPSSNIQKPSFSNSVFKDIKQFGKERKPILNSSLDDKRTERNGQMYGASRQKPGFGKKNDMFNTDLSVGGKRTGQFPNVQKQSFGKQSDVSQEQKPGMRVTIPALNSGIRFPPNDGIQGRRPGSQLQNQQSEQTFHKPVWTGKRQRLTQSEVQNKDFTSSTGFVGDSDSPSGLKSDWLYRGKLQGPSTFDRGANGAWRDGRPNMETDNRLVRGNTNPKAGIRVQAQRGSIQPNIATNAIREQQPKPFDTPVVKLPAPVNSRYQVNTMSSDDSRKSQAGSLQQSVTDQSVQRFDNKFSHVEPEVLGRAHSNNGTFDKTSDSKESNGYQQSVPSSHDSGNIRDGPKQTSESRMGQDSNTDQRPRMGDMQNGGSGLSTGTSGRLQHKEQHHTVNENKFNPDDQRVRGQKQGQADSGFSTDQLSDKDAISDLKKTRNETKKTEQNDDTLKEQPKDQDLTQQSRDLKKDTATGSAGQPADAVAADILKDRQTSKTKTKGTVLVHGTKQWISERIHDSPTNVLHDDVSTYIFSTKSLPTSLKNHPTLSNGHLGTVVGGDWVHMNGLFNGEGSKSHLADLPNTLNAQVNRINGVHVTASACELDVSKGVFFTRYETNDVTITQRLYTHRSIGPLMVLQFEVLVTAPGTPIKISLNATQLYDSPDVELKKLPFVKYNASYGMGRTRVPEHADTETIPVQIIYDEVPETLVVPRDQNHVIWTFLYSAHVFKERAREEYEKGTSLIQSEQIYQTHIRAWTSLWNAGRVEIEGNRELARMSHASLYYVMSAVPLTLDTSWPFFGISPSGLAWGSGKEQGIRTYGGHVFWNMDAWLFPPILTLHPDQAKILLNYRLRHLKQAMANARKHGHKGAQYPWEAAATGLEVSARNRSVQCAVHVSGDVALTIMRYYWSTGDESIFTDDKYDDVITQVADFWISMLALNKSSGLYEIRDVTGPDQLYHGVDNSVYTNAVAQLTLRAAAFVTKLLDKQSTSDMYANYAKQLYLPYDDVMDYHPEFNGYKSGSPVRQSGAVLLGYPLQYDLTKSQRRNDLAIYEKVIELDVPAVPWSMQAIGWLELGEKEKAWENMLRTLKYSHKDFEVWSERVPPKGGVPNYLPGMGGFLQTLLAGYGGIRVTKNKMDMKFELPNDATSVKFVGINYLGHEMTIHVTSSEVVVYVTRKQPEAADLVITSDKETFDLKELNVVRILSRSASISRRKT